MARANWLRVSNEGRSPGGRVGAADGFGCAACDAAETGSEADAAETGGDASWFTGTAFCAPAKSTPVEFRT